MGVAAGGRRADAIDAAALEVHEASVRTTTMREPPSAVGIAQHHARGGVDGFVVTRST